ncbi:MAG TPA: agmatinase, partial [Candidatus Nitrosotenuis sp.]|nr:agmatinase [Candidatus Nitrosotenuis sp.]
MSYLDLYLNKDPLIISPGESNAPVATVYGIPFDSTHSYKPGCRFGPDAIRKAFNNIEIFHPDLGVDLEGVSIEDLGNAMHTANVEEMLDMVSKITSELTKKERLLIILGGEHSLTYGTYT